MQQKLTVTYNIIIIIIITFFVCGLSANTQLLILLLMNVAEINHLNSTRIFNTIIILPSRL